MYCYVWSYAVRPEHLQVLSDRNDPARFMTIDYWSSREACASFRERFRGEFDSIDKSCEALTVQEIHVGDFDVLGESA